MTSPLHILRFEPFLDIQVPGRGGRAGKRHHAPPSKNEVLHRIGRNVRGDPQVMVKITSKSYSLGQARAHALYITRSGQLAGEDENGFALQDAEATREKLKGWNLPNNAIELSGGRKVRQTLNFVFGMPAGTDPAKVLQSSRAVAQKKFGGHEYVLVLHEPRTDPKPGAPKHPHVHILVRAEGDDGRRLQVDKADLMALRETFAAEMRALGVRANASSRAERFAKRGKSRAALALLEREAARLGTPVEPPASSPTQPSASPSPLADAVRHDYSLLIAELIKSPLSEHQRFAQALGQWVGLPSSRAPGTQPDLPSSGREGQEPHHQPNHERGGR